MVRNSVTTKRAPTNSVTAPTPVGGPETKNTQVLFNSAAIGMSWQLAVVVLVPIVGGYKLDQRFHSSAALDTSRPGLGDDRYDTGGPPHSERI